MNKIKKNKEMEVIRNSVIEECAKELEKAIDALNKVMIRERRLVQEDTLWVFEVEKEIRQSCINILRRLKTNENTSI
uniref:Uncharacterized protein n=1 Tax=viral metagenome TaxID=1070528 RepID=A0A6M3JIH6_9ZZZZ